MQDTIDSVRQDYGEKTKKPIEYLTAMFASMMENIIISKYSLDKNDLPKDQYPTTVIPANWKDPPLEGGNSTNIGCMWNLKHDIRSPKFYEILINTELKVDTALDLKNFYNHIKMCVNAVTRP